MSEHRIDYLSLAGAIVFLSLGLVGLARSIGWIDHGAGFWALAATTAALGCVGAVAAIRGMTTPSS